MSVAAFLTAALESALDNGVATPEDLLRHATPDVIATHVPRPVWARLLTTCLAAPRVDARLVVDTVGVATLCEHVPATIMWGCLAEVALRTLGRGLVAAPPSVVAGAPPAVAAAPAASAVAARATPATSAVAARVATPPRGTSLDASGRAVTAGGGNHQPVAAAGTPPQGTLDPAAEITRVAQPPPELSKLAAEKSETRGELTRVAVPPREPEPLGEPPAPPRAPGATTRASAATQPPATGRRPQASAAAPAAKAPRGTQPAAKVPRASTATDFEIETDVSEQWKRTPPAPPSAIDVVVDDAELVDWSAAEETATSGDKYGDRKR
ncbi:MAG: hypothetical protein KJZ91_08065 [Myxococcales bacterium]|nr:hypothetical protein [Myxococcales bacterium]